jgi:hypothetical protein
MSSPVISLRAEIYWLPIYWESFRYACWRESRSMKLQVWAPKASTVSASIGDEVIAMTRGEDGYWEIDSPLAYTDLHDWPITRGFRGRIATGTRRPWLPP